MPQSTQSGWRNAALLASLAVAALLALVTTWTAALARVPQQRAAVERLLRAQTGLDVSYGRLVVRLGFYGPEAEFSDLEMRRPGTDAPLLRAPRMVARFESWRLLRGGQLRPGRVLVSGGFSTATPYRYAELFDPVSETFRPVNAPVREVLSQQVAVLHIDGSVLLMGGETYTAEGLVPRAEVWRFDAGSDTFSARPPLARGRTLAAAVALRDGRVLLFGGQTEPDRHSASAERYDPVAGGQALAALDRERAYLSANRLPDGRVLVAGGESTQGAFADQLLIYE